MAVQREIVHVLDDGTLLNEESYQCAYKTESGLPLSAGFYVVSWPSSSMVARYDEHASFVGPLTSRTAAAVALDAVGEESIDKA